MQLLFEFMGPKVRAAKEKPENRMVEGARGRGAGLRGRRAAGRGGRRLGGGWLRVVRQWKISVRVFAILEFQFSLEKSSQVFGKGMRVRYRNKLILNLVLGSILTLVRNSQLYSKIFTVWFSVI